MLPTSLFALLSLAAPQHQEVASPDSYSSVEIELEHLPASQRSIVDAARPLGESLALQGVVFEVESRVGATFVATQPESPARTKLRHGDSVPFEWMDGEEPRRLELLFEQDERGQWTFGAHSARLFEVDGLPLCLIDLNLDGQYGTTLDGWSWGAGAPVLPLASRLVIGARELRIVDLAKDGSSMRASFTEIAGVGGRAPALERLNQLRQADGLDPVTLNSELSSACSAHARYLAANNWDGESDPHDQDPRGKETSREGRAAASQSEILALPAEEAIDALWSNPRTRALFGDPDLNSIGLSETKFGFTVIDAKSRGTRRERGRSYWRRALLSPAHGSFGHTTRFATLADPEPVKGARRMGTPLLLRWMDPGADIDEYRAKLSKPGGSPVRVELLPPAGPGGSIRGVLPSRPLASNAEYVVRHEITVEGELFVLEARFRTR